MACPVRPCLDPRMLMLYVPPLCWMLCNVMPKRSERTESLSFSFRGSRNDVVGLSCWTRTCLRIEGLVNLCPLCRWRKEEEAHQRTRLWYCTWHVMIQYSTQKTRSFGLGARPTNGQCPTRSRYELLPAINRGPKKRGLV